MTRYGIEILTRTGYDDRGREQMGWRRLTAPRAPQPYGWDTRAKAEQMLRVCFGPSPNPERVRIVEVDDTVLQDNPMVTT